MSMDTRIMLCYEQLPYSDNFPFSVIDELNNDPDTVWLDRLVQAGTDLVFIGWVDHFPYKVLEKCKADQIFLRYSGGQWKLQAPQCVLCGSTDHDFEQGKL